MNVDKTQVAPIAVGAVAGAGIGAVAGVTVANKRPVAAEYKKAATAFADARDTFVTTARETVVDIKKIKSFVGKDEHVKTAGKKLKEANKAKAGLAADATDKAKKAAQAAVDHATAKLDATKRKAAVSFLKKEDNKGIKENIEKAVKTFTEGPEGKKLAEAVEKAQKAFKNTKVKWVAGIAAAGLALGALVGVVVNKVKANKEAE